MKVLVDAQKKLKIPLSNPENDLLGNQLLLYDNTAALNNETFPQFTVNFYFLHIQIDSLIQSMLSNLWSDRGIRRAFER